MFWRAGLKKAAGSGAGLKSKGLAFLCVEPNMISFGLIEEVVAEGCLAGHILRFLTTVFELKGADEGGPSTTTKKELDVVAKSTKQG